MSHASLDKWKMHMMEEFNTFSEPPGRKLICLQRQRIEMAVMRQTLHIFARQKRQEY